MSGNIDLSKLPVPDIIETLDYEAFLVERQQKYISLFPAEQQAEIAARVALESDPANKMLQESCYREIVLRARYNNEARALLVAFATGTDLDHIGVTYYQEPRLLIYAGDPDANPPVADIYENDDEYRYRLLLKPESYSVAGPRGAFEFHALSASGKVKSVGVVSPYPGTTVVYVLARDGDGTPDADLLDIVDQRLNDETIRPLSEEVLVKATELKTYDVDIGLVVYDGPDSQLVLEESIKAVNLFVQGHHSNGDDVTLTALIAAAHQPGVKKVVVNGPLADITCDESQAAYCASVNIGIAGTES